MFRFRDWVRVGFVQPFQESPLCRPHCEAEVCGRQCHHHHIEEATLPLEIPTVRYALFGRPDCGYNDRWSYYAWDAINGVPIPVGVERNQWQLQSGDPVRLLGTPGLWVVVKTDCLY
jgi:hypothetical protein